MLTMVIADDEKLLLDSLVNCIDWNAMGIRVVAGCSNGIEALEAVIDESPDIVMTDIKMPGLDGLELIEQINRMDKDIEFIILSGYREFEFAKQAMQFGVREYLLKPLDDGHLTRAVESARKNHMAKAQANRDKAEHEKLYRQIREQKRALLLYDLFSPNRQAAVSAYTAEYGETASGYCTAYFTFVAGEAVEDFSRFLCGAAAEKGAELFFRPLYVTETVAAVFAGTGEKVAEAIKKAANFQPKSSIEIFVQQEETQNLTDCAAGLAAKLIRFSEIWVMDDNHRRKELFSEGVMPEKLDALVERILYGKETGDYSGAKALTQNYLGTIQNSTVLRIYGVQLFTRLAVANVYNLGEIRQVLAGFYETDDPEELVEIILRKIGNLIPAEQTEDSLIQQIKAYVKENLADSDLSLKQIAQEQVHLNVDYLSHLFATRTGEKFSRYLNHLRVETAKRLLGENENKIYFVAERVGCGHNPRYFSQIFRKYTGMTPTAYVEGLREGE